ncbi:TonB-dependent receptor [Marivirga tractuosa]|uniref:TonB-dependent receptor n=1 Tax=Marivirga tractuosa (strain ATCC 23168 / DSM 4126 / NBRC 15989 / NCIMB 1408 / VKM B-1430 / H-43) TaxID=643867 RepID=E4TLT5_MARTH|nr:TonB-dependent receptor [Marivirga tractuosa]ADR23364.1 TonB-dependent receptor [Marivirga tractuosa DSM 4126]BDD15962.1 TonB-dependent receptor [Marivirga tractuosa]
MRLGILFLLLWFSNGLWAQNHQDSISVLEEVYVHGNFEKQFLPGNTIILPKAKTLEFYDGANISEILKQNSSIYFKEYGNGMLTTIAFRGTNASQTAVLWDNFNINSFTLGQTDFSLLPSQAISEISIIPGSGSTMGGSGAFGGAVLLENPLSFKTENTLSIGQQIGSFGLLNSNVNATGSNGKWAYDTRLYWGKAENDFEILQTGEKQDNASFERWGINQSIGYKISNTEKIKLAIWYNDNFREIQPPIGSTRDINEQEDHNLRTHLNFDKKVKNGLLSIGSGYFMDEMDYQLNQAISYNKVNRWESFATYKHHFSKNHEVKLSTRHNYIEANNQSYESGSAIEQRYSLGALFKGQIIEGIDYALHLRQQLVPGVNIPVSPYAGISYQLIQHGNHKLKLKLNSSFNYRLPTLNDRFWNEAGNPELNSETAWNKEMTLQSSHQWLDVKTDFSITAYHNDVVNWIQWVPDENNQWRPRNIKEVLAKGVETQMGVEFPVFNYFKIQTNFQYSYTQSTVLDSEKNSREIGKQLIYTPLHKANATASLSWKKFSLNSFHQWTGKVYTTNSNSELFALDSFLLSDIGLSWKSTSWHLSAKAKNTFNTEYFLYSGYAMPGRNYQISITRKFKFK